MGGGDLCKCILFSMDEQWHESLEDFFFHFLKEIIIMYHIIYII